MGTQAVGGLVTSPALGRVAPGGGAPYKGMQAENDGVVGTPEVIESHLASLGADTEAAAATAQEIYDTLATDSKVGKDIEHKTAKSRRRPKL